MKKHTEGRTSLTDATCKKALRTPSATAFFIVAAFLMIVLTGACQASPSSTKFQRIPSTSTTHASIERDVPYCVVDGIALTMDVYYPDSDGPWPVFLFIHGGAWERGDKSEVDPFAVDHGYLVVSINYRLDPLHRFPAMIQDVKCAIRSLRANADTYNLDPDRIALVGYSAGGHLAALAGARSEPSEWDVGDYLDQSSQVAAVVTIAAPTSLTLPYPDGVAGQLRDVFTLDGLASASPVTYISRDDPPFLVIHGEDDTIVPVGQATALAEALAAENVPYKLIIVPGASHSLDNPAGDASPRIDEIKQSVMDFLTEHLR